MNSNPKWRWLIQVGLGLALTALFLYMMAPFILPILLGAVAAILAYPSYLFFRKFFSPKSSSFIVTALVTAGILVPVILLFYTATYRLLTLVTHLRLLRDGQTIEDLAENPIIRRIISVVGSLVPLNREFVKEQSLAFLAFLVEKLSSLIAGFISGMPGLLVAGAVTILSTFFFLTDGSRFLRFLAKLSPLKPERSEELYHSFERSCRGVVLGLFASAAVQSIMMGLLFFITQLPNPVFIGLLTLIAGMIPFVGSAPIWVGATFYLLGKNNPAAASIMLLGGLGVSLADNVVRPWVMKENAEMHPFLALVSVFGAIQLLGPAGIFLGPIIAAVFVSFLKIVIAELRKETLLFTN
ncbi:AI-2E family transporter [bacterium]|nr:AI-2E family transporter [bacterium]